MNPLLPRQYFVPDAEAHVMPDGRLYLYGSLDRSGSLTYCSHEYRVFSTDDPTLSHWVDHGVSFSNTDKKPGVPWQPGVALYAPDAIHKNGKYYLYFCGLGNIEGVAVSDVPSGPFTDAKPIIGADGDSIDPAIFVDDDGQAYYLWGQFSLRGARLKDDMCTLDPESIQTSILTEQEHGFHEGVSLRKRNGKYYIVYTDISRGKATCLSYAMADHPLGPYTKGSVIIDNMYCDPATWNNHGSIEEFHGQWYVFYHRASQNKPCVRRVCAEPIFFNEDGTIREVLMTSQGAEGAISAFQEIDASIACRMKGKAHIVPDAENDSVDSTNELLVDCGGGSWAEAWAEYRNLDFDNGAVTFTVRAKGSGRLRLRVSGMAEEVCTLELKTDEDFCSVTAPLEKTIQGEHALWIQFDGKDIVLDSFSFAK